MIDSRYQLLEKIAESERATLFRAHDSFEGKDVVIKRPTAELAADLSHREADALEHIQHPNVITLEHSGTDDQGPYLILEMLTGETLDARVKRRSLDIAEVESLARQGLLALQAVHEAGFIHRDVKPENLMLIAPEEDAETFHLKLLDFDLAQPIIETLPDTATGSIYFMAPEQFRNHRPDVRTDLYSLGAVLHHALTQRYPFEGETKAQVITAHLYHDCIPLSVLRPDAPEALVSLLSQLVSLNPDQRPASAAEALAQMEMYA